MAAVKAFQQAMSHEVHGFLVDGIAGPQTWQALVTGPCRAEHRDATRQSGQPGRHGPICSEAEKPLGQADSRVATNDLDRRPRPASRRYQTIFDPLPLALRQLTALLAQSHEPVRSVRLPHCQIFHGHADIALGSGDHLNRPDRVPAPLRAAGGHAQRPGSAPPPGVPGPRGHFPVISSLPL